MKSDAVRDPYNADGRQRYGVTVQAVSPTGARRLLVRDRMPPREGLRAAVEEIERWGDGWKVETISSPGTIYRDLQGSRRRAQRGVTRLAEEAEREGQSLVLPEVWMLSSIGRLDMLAGR